MNPMKEVRLAYGRDGIVATVPDDAVVVTATELPGLPDEAGGRPRALRAPVEGHRSPSSSARRPAPSPVTGAGRDGSRGWRRAAGGGGVPRPHETHAQPHRPAARCSPSSSGSGVGPDHVDLLCATGTHRAATAEEMVELVGPDIAGRYTVHQHRADAPRRDHVEVGTVDGDGRSGSTVATSRPTFAS